MTTKKDMPPHGEQENNGKQAHQEVRSEDGSAEKHLSTIDSEPEVEEKKEVLVKQPYPVSAMQADLDLQQLRILAAVMMKLVGTVRDMFEDGKRNLAHLCNKYGRLEVEVMFKDVTDIPANYSHVERSAKAFMALCYRHEDKDRRIVELTHFVDRVHFPSDTKTRKYIVFEFTEEQAEKILDFNFYSTYLASVVFNINHKYAARLYMLFNSMRGYAKSGDSTFHWYIDYGELRKILGIDEVISRTSVKQKAYKQYKDFKKRVLESSAKELKLLADMGKSDCWFEYRELPDSFDGHPERLDFTVHVCEDVVRRLPLSGEEEDTLGERLKKMFGFTDKDVAKIEDHMPHADNKQVAAHCEERLLKKAEEILATIEKKGKDIKNKRVYALVSLVCEAEAMEDERIEAKLDVVERVGKAEDCASDCPPEEPADRLSPNERERIAAWVRDRWLSAVGMKMYNMYVGTSDIVWRQGIEVEVGHDDTARWFEDNRVVLEKAVGRTFKVRVKP